MSPIPRERPLAYQITIFVCCLIALIGLGWVGFIGSDDTTYALGAYGWLEHFPFVGGHGTIRYTITLPIALSFLSFGENEFALALPTILYTVGLAVMFIYAVPQSLDRVAPVFVGAALITCPALVILSSMASIDIVEAFFVFLSLFLFRSALSRNADTFRLIAAGAMAGLGFLTRETTVFLLLFYGLLFLAGYGIKRTRYFLMAAGFLGIWLAEILYLTVMTGDPLYRVNISLHHDSTIDRSIDLAGNVILHPLVDPLLVILVNQEFGVLFWIAIPCFFWLVTKRNKLSSDTKSFSLLLSGLAVTWFVAVGAVQHLLPLNPRYFLVPALAAAAVTGITLTLLSNLGRKRAALAIAVVLVSGNLAGIYVENRNYMFGETALAEFAERTEEPIYTDPVTRHRADMLLKWNATADRVFGTPPPKNGLFLYNPTRATTPSRLMQRGEIQAFQPKPEWQLIEKISPSPKFGSAVFRILGLEPFLPARLRKNLSGGHPGVSIYRRP